MGKILVIGSNGQVGSELTKLLTKRKFPFTALDHSQIEMKDYNLTRKIIQEVNPKVIINTSAFHKVDLCEDKPEEAFRVNSLAVKNLAEICGNQGINLVHFSTDYIFDGNKGSAYTEKDSPNPLGVYGNSKLSGEYFIKNTLANHFLIRTSAVQGLKKSSVKGSNFIETMLKFGEEKGLVKVVGDQIITPTYASDLAEKTLELISTNQFGTYHLTNGGEMSWHTFAKKIFDSYGMDVQVESIDSEEAAIKFNYKTKRPPYSALRSINLKKIGLKEMRPFNDALNEYLEERKYGV